MKIYHHNDADGRCAGAIAFRALKVRGYNPKTIEMDYKDQLNFDDIENGEALYILDFSFKPKIMTKILTKTTEVVWIDHHKTAIDYSYNLPGKFDINRSGCELSWDFFYGNNPPMTVKLIGDYDTWQFKMGEKSELINLGLKLHPHQPEDEIWDHLLSFDINAGIWLTTILDQGETCRIFRDMICADYAKSQGFETEFDGYKAFAMGLYMFGSKAFGQKIKEYPLCISFEFDGRHYTIGLYSEQIDVGDLAKKHGGGGHKGAAGFVTDSLPFKKVGI